MTQNSNTPNFVSSTLPPKIPASNPPYHEVSDKIWTDSDELLDRFLSNSSLTVTRVSTGSPIMIQKSQSPENVEVLPEETSDNETANVQVIPPSFNNPIPKMIS